MSGLIGWSVAVPTLLGAMLGLWLDRRHPGAHSWTLMLLVVGLVHRLRQCLALGSEQDKAMHDETSGRRGGTTMSETLAAHPRAARWRFARAIFFGGLWWTIRRSVSSKQPALLFFWQPFSCER